MESSLQSGNFPALIAFTKQATTPNSSYGGNGSNTMDISKEIPPKAHSGLIFKGLRPEANAEYPAIICQITSQTLKNKTTGI